MIVHGGEPPFVEKPDPKFGGVVSKLNEAAYSLQDSVYSFNESTQQKITDFNKNLAEFIAAVVGPVDAHIASRGAVHGETKKTIGLGKKDNYRTATLAEQTNLTPVLAYVTPQGAQAALVKNLASYDPTKYQMNDSFQFASYFYPDEYQIGTPTVVQGPRYFTTGTPVPLLVNGDRLIASPVSDAANYQKQSLFVSGPSKTLRTTKMGEIQNINVRFASNNWNALGAETTDGKVNLFKPVADKKIYTLKNSLPGLGDNKNFLLYSGYGSTTYKGLATGVTVSGNVVTLKHTFFKADLLETDPTLIPLLANSYNALYTRLGENNLVASLSGGHNHNLNNFLTLQPGQSLEVDTSLEIATSLTWASQDYEIYFFVAVPVILRGGGLVKKKVISFIMSIIPGSLFTGGSGVVTQMGNLAKDVIGPNLEPVGSPNWIKDNDLTDINNPVQIPGVVMPNGEIVKAATTRYGIRIKRIESGHSSLKGWLTGQRPKLDVRLARTEIFTPSRHSPFGPIPERIVPVSDDGISFKCLVNSLDEESGQYEWKELAWDSGSVTNPVKNSKFGIMPPVIEDRVPNLGIFPKSLTITGSYAVNGISINSLAFTTENGFKGNTSFVYGTNKTLKLGSVVTLSPATVITLKAAGNLVRSRAKAANPTVSDALREINIQVFTLTPNKAIAIVSDGVCYAEGAVLTFTLTGNIFKLVVPEAGLGLQALTVGNKAVSGVNRFSGSGDDPKASCDLLVIEGADNSRRVVATRPFGKVYGDLSFTIPDINAIKPLLLPLVVNPGSFYKGTKQIDLVDELHPPLLIPRKGIFQCEPGSYPFSTPMLEVGGVTKVDPYDINEEGWVRVPAGSKVVIGGRAYILDREYPIKVNPVGVSYCYLTRIGADLFGLASSTRRETVNNEVLFGVATNGILNINHSYLVLDNHVVTPNRRGAAVPAFSEDGGLGVNQFFTQRDRI